MSAAPRPCVNAPQSAGWATEIYQPVDLNREMAFIAMVSGRCVNVSIRQGQILTYTYPDTYPFMHTSRAYALYTYRKSKIDLRLTY